MGMWSCEVGLAGSGVGAREYGADWMAVVMGLRCWRDGEHGIEMSASIVEHGVFLPSRTGQGARLKRVSQEQRHG